MGCLIYHRRHVGTNTVVVEQSLYRAECRESELIRTPSQYTQ
jgi:hypothetical protein